jgi:hypothetical protein
MHLRSFRLVAVPFVVACASCSAAPGDPTGSTSSDISGSTIVSRGMEWVDASLHYCQSARGAVDGDSSCWAWEGASHVCDRESNSAWNAYRSDCSGFVTWAWGLPPVGDGGYVTGDFAPFGSSISHTIAGSDLQPGDALNKTTNEHIVLFVRWETVGQSAVFLEEPGCSVSTPYAHEFTSDVSITGDEVYISYEGGTFYSIRFSGSAGGSTPPPAGGSSCSLGGHTYGQNTCTETLQCDDGRWVDRSGDPATCDKGIESNGACVTDSGAVVAQNTCTSTLQCDDGDWVERTGDPSECLGGSSGSCSLAGHSYGQNTCTETLQCDNGSWVARTGDPASCDKGFESNGECLTDGGSVVAQNTCTSTLQCDDGVWVDRQDDPTSCL